MTTERIDGLTEHDSNAFVERRIVNLRRWRGEQASPAATSWEPRVGGDAGPVGHGPLDLSLRSARFRDLLDIARLEHVAPLNQPDLLLRGYSQTSVALRAVLPGGRSRPRVLVACSASSLVGFLHAQVAYPDLRWHIVALGTSTGVFDAAPVEDALIRHGVTQAGLRGVKRIYVRAPSGHPLLESFQRVTFAPYATETIFACDGFQSGGERIALRPQEASDTWAIHQLYNATAPRQVQYAEAFTSHRWDVSGPDELGRDRKRFGWIVEEGNALAAYARVSCAGSNHVIEMLYQPERRTVLGPLLDSVVNQLRTNARVGRLYCSLRGYQVEAANVLEQRGFDPVLEQDLLVKYTTATSRTPQVEHAIVHSEVIERLPKRVPSFLNQKAGDEVVG